MYLILSTYDPRSTRNLGDKLLADAAIQLIHHVKGEVEVKTVFRATPYADLRPALSACTAVVLPGFAVRHRLTSETYPALIDLLQHGVPLLPLGIGTKIHPPDFARSHVPRPDRSSMRALSDLAESAVGIAARDLLSQAHLSALGLSHVPVSGDCAWYHPPSLGKPFPSSDAPRRVAFTPPHEPAYASQARAIVKLVAEMFPGATRVFSHHSRPKQQDLGLEAHARGHGFEVTDSSGGEDLTSRYASYDLHIGYRLHGHLAFLRQRIPSILLHEDSRGLGATLSLGHGGLDAFSHKDQRSILDVVHKATPINLWRSRVRRRISRERPDPDVPKKLEKVVEEECSTGFRSYEIIQHTIDETFKEVMRPIIDRLAS